MKNIKPQIKPYSGYVAEVAATQPTYQYEITFRHPETFETEEEAEAEAIKMYNNIEKIYGATLNPNQSPNGQN